MKTPSGARRAALPSRISFQLCQPCAEPPEGAEWIHEIKHDGHRAAVILDGKGGVRVHSRNGFDRTERFGPALDGLPQLGRAAVLDGEIAAPDAEGRTHLDSLARAIRFRLSRELAFYAFDVLHLDGHDLTGCALADRKAVLSGLLQKAGAPRVVYVDDFAGSGADLFAAACEAGAEGIVSKRRDARYRPGPGSAWLKCKRTETGQFLVIAFEEIAPGRLDCIHVAEPIAGELVHRGRVQFGLAGRGLWRVLNEIRENSAPRPPKEAIRVRPMLRAQVRYFGRHAGGYLRDGVLRSLDIAD